MKINRLETHDRYQQFANQRDNISQCCQSLIDKQPFGDVPFYIFAHKREIGMDEKFSLFSSGMYSSLADIPTHRMIWQPRLTKPKAQTNSMLFKGYPGTDTVKVIWIIPERELWDQYRKGNLTESSIVVESIDAFEHDRAKLEAKDPDDLPDATIDRIYKEIGMQGRKKKHES